MNLHHPYLIKQHYYFQVQWVYSEICARASMFVVDLAARMPYRSIIIPQRCIAFVFFHYRHIISFFIFLSPLSFSRFLLWFIYRLFHLLKNRRVLRIVLFFLENRHQTFNNKDATSTRRIKKPSGSSLDKNVDENFDEGSVCVERGRLGWYLPACMPCRSVMHSCHAFMPCIHAMHSCHAFIQCIHGMHSFHAFLYPTFMPSINFMHSCHVFMPCIHSMHCMPGMHACHAYMPCIPVMHSCHTFMPCIPAMHSCHAFLPCIHAIHSCQALMPYIHAMHSCHAFMPYIPAMHSCHTFMPYIHAMHSCHAFMPSIVYWRIVTDVCVRETIVYCLKPLV